MVPHLKKMFWLMFGVLAVLTIVLPGCAAEVSIFTEGFDANRFEDRQWYDKTSVDLSTYEKYTGVSAAEFRYTSGSYRPRTSNGETTTLRRQFSPTRNLIVRYRVKYSANWDISHPTRKQYAFHVMTTADGRLDGPANTFLSVHSLLFIGQPTIAITDVNNIILNRNPPAPPVNPEHRAVAGCDGTADAYLQGLCYQTASNLYNNYKAWAISFTYPTSGPDSLNQWHLVEWHVKLNTIENGIARADGVIRFRLDGQERLNLTDVVFRTAEHANMAFNQFIISPYIPRGATREQTFWIDDLEVGREDPDPPAPPVPTNIRIIN